MDQNEHQQLLSELSRAYQSYAPKSAALHEQSQKYLVDGGSHSLRLIEPFPPRIVEAQGAHVIDEDGHRILDFWQGHHANILGHNPEVVTASLARAFQERLGLQTGFAGRIQTEVAEIFCRCTGAERVRFTTSGSLATMYAILLACAHTGRNLVMKVGGGWHGAQPWGLKGVDYHVNGTRFQEVDSAGLPPALTDEVLITRFNDTDMLEDHFNKYGPRVACFIVEPFIGAGGFIPASREYLQTARELTSRHGALLILDEVISGFRFRAGSTAFFYQIEPDLATYGKIMGGGMPVAAVAGIKKIMEQAGKSGMVRFEGGTYSAHPASMLAARVMLEYLVGHEEEIYPRLSDLGKLVRKTVVAAFAEEGLYAFCTGHGNDALPESSLSMLLFPREEGFRVRYPEETRDPAVVDLTLSNEALQIALLLEDIHIFHGLGSISTAHSSEDIEYLGQACRRAAGLFKKHRF